MSDRRQFSVRQLALRAFDLSERTAAAGRKGARAGARRWRRRIFSIAQCAVTAGIAWWVAHSVFGHPAPFYAAVAAIITLGFSYGQRLARAVHVGIGVTVGVLVGEVFQSLFGSGPWQIALVCVVGMSIATLLGASHLMATQASVQAIIVTALPSTVAASPFGRWIDALIGCGLALVVASVAPSNPVRQPLILAAGVLKEAAGTLRAAAEALRGHDPGAANAVLERARASEASLVDLDSAAAEGLAVVRSSPFRRQQRQQVRDYAALARPLDRLIRNLRVLARRATVAAWRGNDVPASYLSLMDSLVEVMEFMAGEMYAGRLPTAARTRLDALGTTSSHLPMAGSISAVVLLAQQRSMLADLLELIGVDAATARDSIPDLS